MRKSSAYGSGYIFKRRRMRDGKIREDKTYTIAYPHDGQERRESTGTSSYQEAMGILKDRLSGKDIPEPSPHSRVTIDTVYELIRADYQQQGRKSFEQIKKFRWPNLQAFFGDRDLRNLDESDLLKYADHRTAQGASNATINRERSALLRALNLARRRKLLTSVPHVSKLKESSPRKGFIERADFMSVLAALPAGWRDLFRVAYITGWRVASELLPLRWSQVDFIHRYLRLEPGTTKNDDGRMFPFTPELEAALKSQRARVDAVEREIGHTVELVFPSLRRKGKGCERVYHVFKRAAQKANMGERMPHDFRRTAVRNLEFAGVDRAAAMLMVGHKTEAIYRRYNIVDARRIEVGRQKLTAYESQFPSLEIQDVVSNEVAATDS